MIAVSPKISEIDSFARRHAGLDFDTGGSITVIPDSFFYCLNIFSPIKILTCRQRRYLPEDENFIPSYSFLLINRPLANNIIPIRFLLISPTIILENILHLLHDSLSVLARSQP